MSMTNKSLTINETERQLLDIIEEMDKLTRTLQEVQSEPDGPERTQASREIISRTIGMMAELAKVLLNAKPENEELSDIQKSCEFISNIMHTGLSKY